MAHASIAVGEGVDRLKLRMDDSGLDQRSMGGPVQVVDEVGHQFGYTVGGRRDEVRSDRAPVRAADPVLHCAQAVVLRLVGKQRLVKPGDVVDRQT